MGDAFAMNDASQLTGLSKDVQVLFAAMAASFVVFASVRKVRHLWSVAFFARELVCGLPRGVGGRRRTVHPTLTCKHDAECARCLVSRS
jgi:hypothetical protein